VCFEFGPKKTSEAEADSNPVERPGAKNRPTPKRRAQEAARKQPLVPTDRKAAGKTDKAKAREERVKRREAMMRGDERYLPARDKGPIKRFIRDTVDSRWNIGEFLLPLMVVVLALAFVRNATTQFLVLVLVYGIVVIGVVDAFFLWRRIRKRIEERFHEAPPRGSMMYAVMRSFQMRRSRMPKPQVERGDKPR
jgi:Flp pilus assembly protein TadB